MWSATWASVARGSVARDWGLAAAISRRACPRADSSQGSAPRRSISAVSSRSQAQHSGETNGDTKVTMHIPRLPGSRARMPSGTLRGWSHRARALECEKMTGASATSSASLIVAGDTWDRSTSMPSRCISRTTARPNSVSPPARGWSVAESAQGTLALWVSVRYRTPSAYSARSTPIEDAMLCPPSAPSSDATRPVAKTRCTSSAVSASSSWPG